MANIKITVEGPLMDGHKVTFKAPCNCDVVEKLDVRYIENNTQKSKLFTMKDSHGNDLTGLGNLFFKDAYVDVVLDPNSGSAYLQNAGTNGYLEERLKTAGTPVDNLLSDRADLPLSARQGKILNESLTNEDNESFNFGVKDGVRGFFTNPSRADDSFIPFSRLTQKTMIANGSRYNTTFEIDSGYSEIQVNSSADGYKSANKSVSAYSGETLVKKIQVAGNQEISDKFTKADNITKIQVGYSTGSEVNSAIYVTCIP